MPEVDPATAPPNTGVNRDVPDYVVAEQEIATHVFVPLDGTDPHAALAALAGVWARFRASQTADTSVFKALPTDMPAVLPPALTHGSLPLAAVQSADGLDQAVLRRDQDVLNLSLLLGAAPQRTWTDLGRRVEHIVLPVPSSPLVAVSLLLGKTGSGGAQVLAPGSGDPEDDTAPVRHLRLLVPAGQDDRLSSWAWSADGGTELPAFVRYLMHMSVLRYQLTVHRRLRTDWATDEPPLARIRVPFATAAGYRELADPVDQLRAIQRCVDAAWRNANTALDRWRSAEGPDLVGTEVLDDDRALVTWFGESLRNDLFHARLGQRLAAPPGNRAAADEPADAHRTATEEHDRMHRTPHEQQARVLAVCDEWFPAKGGLSTLNRLLCVALADAGADVTVLLVKSSEEERADASGLGVRLLDAERPGHTGRESLMRRPRLPAGWVPDLVIGHGRVTGPAARTQAEDHFPGARRLQFLHVEPEQAEWRRALRPEGDVGAVVDRRTDLEFDLCRGAWRTVAVGPRLEAALAHQRRVHGFDDLGPPLRIDPGFDLGPSAQGVPPPDAVPRILVLGRLEEHEMKGLDIACRAVGRAVPDKRWPGRWQLVVRGAEKDSSGELFTRVTEWVDESAVDVSVKPYSADPRRIVQDVTGSSLVLMPSRAEAFGLVGLEAVTAGVPVLVSGRSGLGMLLRTTLSDAESEQVVIDVEAGHNRVAQDVERWARAVSSVMYDLPSAFRRAADLRKRMADEVPWNRAAQRVLDSLRDPADGM